MKWFETITDDMEPDKVYKFSEIEEKLKKIRPELTKSGYQWAINCLLNEEKLIHCGHGEYSLFTGIDKVEYHWKYSQQAEELVHTICNKYPDVQFTVFETFQLNEFLNHLIAQNTVFIQVEKTSSIYIFRYLHENRYKKLLYNPDRKDLALYWLPDTIVVTDMISEAPFDSENAHAIALEKMLVDICADKRISSLFSKAELPSVFQQSKDRYKLEQKKLLRYARRRNKEQEIRKYLGG